MPRLLERVWGWWQPPQPSAMSPVPFAIACPCGHKVTGQRRRHHQVVPCPRCGAEVFVLPLSPLPPPAAPDKPAPAPQAVPAPRRLPVKLILLLGCAALGLGILVGVVLLATLQPLSQSSDLDRDQLRTIVEDQWKTADEHLTLGHFAIALELLDDIARLQSEARIGFIDPVALRLRRQEIALYATLLSASLEELLAEAIDLPEQEWQQQFLWRYHGKAVILTGSVSRRADGTLAHSYLLRVNGQQGVLDLGGLERWFDLKENQQQEVIFGARLESIDNVRAGVWQVQFDPDSLILLTEPSALAVACPALADPATLALLAAQKDIMLKKP